MNSQIALIGYSAAAAAFAILTGLLLTLWRDRTRDEYNQKFNIRMSNTEPVVRLNVETRGDRGLLEEKTKEVLTLVV